MNKKLLKTSCLIPGTSRMARAVLFLLSMVCFQLSWSQSITTGLPSAASSGAGTMMGVTFAIENTNATPITLTAIDFYMSSANGAATWTLWSTPTSLSGPANVVAPVWTSVGSVTAPAPTATAIIPLFTSLSYVIPPATTYRFAIISSGGSINYGGAATLPNVNSASGVNLLRGGHQIAGMNVGYSGSSPNISAFNPRYFCGTIYFTSSGSACTAAPNAPTITTAAMTTPICTGTTKALTATVATPPTAITYQWEQSASSTGPWANVTGGTGATTLSYTTAALTTSTWYRLKATCATFSSYSTAYQVLVSPLPTVSIAASLPNPICPTTSVVFTATPSNAGASPTYQWTKNGVNVGTNSPTYTNASWINGDAISVTMTAPNACSTAVPVSATPLVMTVGGAISNPGAIVGTPTPCPSSTASYSVPSIPGATTYNWTLPAGWSISSGAGTSNIVAATGTTGGTISVTGSNNCGGLSAAATLSVTTSTTVAAPATITGNLSPCVGSTQTYSVPTTAGVTYSWTIPAGWTLISGTGTHQIVVTPSATVGNISVVALTPCATSVPKTQLVSPAPNLTPSVIITSTAINNLSCSGRPITFTANVVNGGPAPQYVWFKNGLASGVTTATYTDSTLVSSDFISVTITSNSPCLNTAIANATAPGIIVRQSVVPGITVNTVPSTALCAGTMLNFSSVYVGQGTAPSFQWYRNGNIISGAVSPNYSTAAIAHADTFSVVLSSSEVCASMAAVTSNKVGVSVSQAVTPTLNVSVNPGTNINAGQAVTFTANYSSGGTAPSFQWYKNNAPIPGAIQPAYTTSNLTDGDRIKVQYYSDAPCATVGSLWSPESVIRIGATSVRATQGAEGIQVYPNPTNGHFSVKADWAGMNNARLTIELTNALGMKVYSKVVDRYTQGNVVEVSVGHEIANGLYHLRVGNTTQQAVRTLFIQR